MTTQEMRNDLCPINKTSEFRNLTKKYFRKNTDHNVQLAEVKIKLILFFEFDFLRKRNNALLFENEELKAELLMKKK